LVHFEMVSRVYSAPVATAPKFLNERIVPFVAVPRATVSAQHTFSAAQSLPLQSASVCAEHQRPDARRDIEAGLGLHTQGLQDKATARAADQGVGADAITHRRLRADAALCASKRARRRVGGRFQRHGRDELYRGRIVSLDLGSTGKTAIAWAVLAPTE
jgi:hypothetical protein